MIKSLTSGDRISVRGLYQDFFEMDPRFKIWVATNSLPKNRSRNGRRNLGGASGLFRLDVSFWRGREDRRLLDTLLGELSGILNWAIRGCLLWQKDGLGEVQVVQDATGRASAGKRCDSRVRCRSDVHAAQYTQRTGRNALHRL